MYVDTSHSKTYTRYLLRDSFRENGKVKHRTIANLSSCSEEEIAAIKLALKYKGDLAHLVNVKAIETKEGMRVGAVFSLKVIADRIGLIPMYRDWAMMSRPDWRYGKCWPG